MNHDGPGVAGRGDVWTTAQLGMPEMLPLRPGEASRQVKRREASDGRGVKLMAADKIYGVDS